MKNFAIFNDEEELVMIKDDFRTREEAQQYMTKNGLIGEYYFIGECDDI
ncbi:MAG: hypothetical protein ACLTDM_15295 [Clostridium butyricum]